MHKGALRDIKSLIRRLGPPLAQLSEEVLATVDLDSRNLFLAEIDEIRGRHDIADFQGLDLTIDNDTFLDVLLNSICNDVIGYQTFIDNSIKANRVSQLKKLEELKVNYQENIGRITELENKITLDMSQELKQIISNHPAFDILNSEKITPLFVKLLKVNLEQYNLTDIKDDNNVDFISKSERQDYIVNFYKKNCILNLFPP